MLKKGDRVRLTKDNDMWGAKGDEGVLVYSCDDRWRVEFRTGMRAGEDWLAPAKILEPVGTKWEPKVGERVRMTRKVDGHMSASAATIVESEPGSGYPYLLAFDNREPWMHRGAGIGKQLPDRNGWWVNTHDIEPLPATLRIEAGKYYRTRDGRKVGPMAQKAGGWTGDGGRRMYLANGERYFECDRGGDDQIVALWTDAAKPCKAAEVDTIAEEYGPVVPVATVPVAGVPWGTAEKPKFKVGDRVHHKGLHLDGHVVDVINDHTVQTFWSSKGWGGRDPVDDLELIPSTTTAIVCLIEGGQPKPANRPFVHASEDAARKEAARLAGVHKGSQFGVFVLAGEPAKVEKPQYEHAWQREAANGNKVAAIKELRSITGLGLMPTKAAVESWLATAA